MRFWQRYELGGLSAPFSIYTLLGLALLLPAAVASVLQAYHGLQAEAGETRGLAVAAADTLTLLADTRATSDLTALLLLSRSRTFADREIVAAARRAQESIELLPGWRAVLLIDRKTGDILFEATKDAIEYSGSFEFDASPDMPAAGFGGVERYGSHCPCVHIHVTIPQHDSLVLMAIIDPLVYQRILMRQLPENSVAAIVDRQGEFLARSIDYPQRVGTPATEYVRGAVERGGRGIYEGKTFENLTNYTAYTTSDLTGWSSHVAIDTTLLDRPMKKAGAIVSVGALVAIVAALSLFFLAAREVLDRRRTENRLLQLQRAETMAQFTAGIVHDFRNVVATLQSGLHMIRRKTKNDEIREHVALIETSIARGTKLANQLLSFAHSNETALEPVEIGALFEGVHYLLEQAAGDGVVLSLDVPPHPLLVTANRDQLELALLNLVINAKDAMDGDGTVTIAVADRGEFVEISVADEGPGIPECMRASLFTPFTTSKSHGTGLGLAQVAGMARNAGGKARLAETGDTGTTFVVSLPKPTPDAD